MHGKDGQVSGLVARNFEVSMKWKEKNFETLSFIPNVGGDLMIIQISKLAFVKVNGKEARYPHQRQSHPACYQKGDVITFENFPGRITRLTAQTKRFQRLLNSTSIQLKGRPIIIHRESRDETGQLLLYVSLQTTKLAFIDCSIDSPCLYLYQVKAMLGDRSTPVSDVASISAFSEPMDDRDLAFSMAPWRLV